MEKMRHQLVLQLADTSKQAYDEMIGLEELLIAKLGKAGKVDGHDWGSGHFNIFIHTDDPKSAFVNIQELSGAKQLLPRLKVAYRQMDAEDYTILHPPGLDTFSAL